MTAGTRRQQDTATGQLGQTVVSMRSRDAPAERSRSFIEARFYLGLIGLFVSLTVLWVTLWVSVPVLGGWSSIVITSDSMAPAIRSGDVVVAAPLNEDRLGPGSVVVFQDPTGDGLITHRIVSLNEDGTYQTKGDANRTNDSSSVTPEQVVGAGKILVPLVGLPAIWVWTDAWFIFGLWVAVMVLAVWSARFAVIEKYDPWPRRRETDIAEDEPPSAAAPVRRDSVRFEPIGKGAPDG